jgi:hypothetical protein
VRAGYERSVLRKKYLSILFIVRRLVLICFTGRNYGRVLYRILSGRAISYYYDQDWERLGRDWNQSPLTTCILEVIVSNLNRGRCINHE